MRPRKKLFTQCTGGNLEMIQSSILELTPQGRVTSSFLRIHLNLTKSFFEFFLFFSTIGWMFVWEKAFLVRGSFRPAKNTSISYERKTALILAIVDYSFLKPFIRRRAITWTNFQSAESLNSKLCFGGSGKRVWRERIQRFKGKTWSLIIFRTF